MVIQTTAPERKTMVKAISEHLGRESSYLGPPAFSYSIGNMTVDREGLLHMPDDVDTSDIKAFLISKHWLEPETDRLSISIPAEGFAENTVRNLIFMLYSKQYLLGKAVKGDTIRVDDAAITRLKDALPDDPLDFKALLLDLKAEGLIAGVDITDESVSLSFPLSDAPESIAAYTQLTAAIMAAAKAATRVKPERLQPENEKYSMRGWLVRLGLGGKEGQGTRDVLLKHLKGNSAFRSDAEAQRHRDKYAEIRKIKRDLRMEGEKRDEG